MIQRRFKLKEIEIDDYQIECADAKLIITDKNKELTNEQAVSILNDLNNENIELKKIVNCSNCHYHNYDWYDDGDEFETCDKGNHEEQIYKRFCKDWRPL